MPRAILPLFVLALAVGCSAVPARGEGDATQTETAEEPMGTDAAPDAETRELSKKEDDPFAPGCLYVYAKDECAGGITNWGPDYCLRQESPSRTMRERSSSDCVNACCATPDSREVDCHKECTDKGKALGYCVEDIDACTDDKTWGESGHCQCFDAEPAQNPGAAIDYCKCPFQPGDGVNVAWDNCKTAAEGSECSSAQCAIKTPGDSLLIFSCIHFTHTVQQTK